MNHYHTFYLDDNKKDIKLWNFEKNNPIQLIGDYDHNVIANKLIENLGSFKNKSVIDIGCRDGFYSFLFEKMDGDVTSLDIVDTDTRKYVHSFLNSKTKFIHENLYNIINWDVNVKYDVVFIGDLLVHQENPIGALKLFNTICKEKLIILTDYFEDDYKKNGNIKNYFHYNSHVNENGILSHGHLFFPWIFSERSLISILRTCGYDNFKILNIFEIPSIKVRSIPKNEKYTRKVLLLEAKPSLTSHQYKINFLEKKDYKINPHFCSLYPNFKI